ncbi:MAG TPA: sigma-70 family RNA polymerase sigma factor [Puia sp.]|jgi:RNA polymerase sigma factor (sigma-70 family)|nr:sigma-70 family RNA polymerase sigma factor [Puia sp.]
MQKDDIAAFTELYNRRWKSLYYTAKSILRNDESCRDIVQEDFTSIWQRRADILIEFPKIYLQQATRFQVIKAIHADKASHEFYDRLGTVSADLVLENPLVYKELEHLVRDLLERLPEDARSAFLLNRDEKLTYHEIAERMDISVKTVEKKMSQILRALRKGLSDALMIKFMSL